MNGSARFAASLALLLVLVFAAGVAATPGALPQPGTPTAAATGNAGEIRVSWQSVAGAQFYTVGWINRNDYDRARVSGDWRSAFHYATVPASHTSYTVSGLKAGEAYWTIVGARTTRTGGEAPSWSEWSSPVTTAGRHGTGFCPITGLIIPPGGYLSVGGTTQSPPGSFTLTTATAPTRIRLPYADDPNQLYGPRSGRRFVEVCGNYRHDFNSDSSLDAGWKTIMDSDAGSGFPVVDTHERIAPGVAGHGCQIWNVPATATTAVYTVSIGGYSSRESLAGEYDDAIGLYRIDLASVPATSNVSASPAPSTTPLTNEQLTRRVKPALAQIRTINSEGEVRGGTGFVVRSNGLLVTSRHVVEDADTVTVYMQNLEGRLFTYTGRVLGRGTLADLAVVQLPAGRTYATLPLGNSDAVSGLDEVSAWGYPGGSISGTYPTVTRGVISSKGVYGDVDFLQTDAAINPGNSGGPLIDQYGRVVGVNTMKTVDDTVDNQGFAIASNEVSSRLDTLSNGGPASERYQNVKHGYGYSVDIPRGWYLDEEDADRTIFSPYHLNHWARVRMWDLSDAFVGSSDELRDLAQWRWNVDLPEVAAERYWATFQPISIRSIGQGDNQHYRLEYRRQHYDDDCIANNVEIIALSSSFSTNPFGFSVLGAVCEDSLSRYGAERDAMLNSFRP